MLPGSIVLILFSPTKLIFRSALLKLLLGGTFETEYAIELWPQSGNFSLEENCFQKGTPSLSLGSHVFGLGMQI